VLGENEKRAMNRRIKEEKDEKRAKKRKEIFI
jgi:hypothetical protein